VLSEDITPPTPTRSVTVLHTRHVCTLGGGEGMGGRWDGRGGLRSRRRREWGRGGGGRPAATADQLVFCFNADLAVIAVVTVTSDNNYDSKATGTQGS